MFKKLIALGGAAALLLGTAVPTFAWYPFFGSSMDVAKVTNTAISTANTGGNIQGNYIAAYGSDEVEDIDVGGNNQMITGSATSYAGALTVANTHLDCCNQCDECDEDECDEDECEDLQCPCPHKDFAMVENGAMSEASTGMNGQGNGVEAEYTEYDAEDIGVTGNNNLITGGVNSTARAWTIVNTHISR